MKLTTAGLIHKHLDQVIALFSYDLGVKTIGDFVNKTEILAKEMYFDSDDEDDNNPAFKFKGDMLEILGEIFFNIYSADTAVGLREYHSVPTDEDYGVDGIGINVNGDQVAVQMKYKINPLKSIEYKEISRTDCAGRRIHNLSLINNNTIFVFTTGNGMSNACRTVFDNVIRIIDRKIISGYIDNNDNFWYNANNLILETLES